MSNQILISSGAKLRDLDDVIIGTDGILSSVGFDVPYGVPRLDSNGKILVSELPNSVMEFKGVWNAATNTPYLTNGVGNAGDVWLCNTAGTVDFGAGPITFAVGDYAVYTGSVWARSSGAVGTVTSVGISRDGNALAITGSPITSSGTINLGFSGNNTQYINGAGNLTTFPTLITSIGLTMPAAFNVSNSPLTANGTIGVTAAGYASQYIRGDGTLADFPSSGGGGSSVSYYLNGGTSEGTIGGTTYYQMSKTADTGAMVDFSKTGDGLICAFLTDSNDPALLQIPAGNWNYEIYASMSSNGGTPEMYAELYVYNGSTFTLISTSSNEILYDGTNLNLYTFSMTVPQTALTVTDRLAIKLYATNSGGKTTTIHTQDSHLCQVITTFSTGLTALNGLTAQVQYFGTGTSGTDFNIVSSVNTHTFNIPSASATARGLITTGSQTIAGSKTLTDTTTFIGGPVLYETNLTYSNSGYTLVLQSPTLSVNRTVTLPNGTGTLALTSDISYPVTSVFGRTGAIVATSGDYNTDLVSEGLTNLYFTNARARTAISLTTTGTTGAATYNSTTGVLNIPNYADQYVGTVTSVGLSAPTGFSVSGSPVTSSGTLALAFASGYSLPTTVKQSNWDDAYTWVSAFPTQTGNTGKFLTTNGSILSWADNPLGTVTSVAMTVPTGLSVSGTPITTSGTLAVTLTAGYSIPTTANQTNWTTAYNDSIISAAVTGTTTKTLTLNQQDGGTVTASWTDYDTAPVTSVFGRTGAIVATEGDYNLTQLGDVTITSPTTGQVLKYNGTTWINDTDANTGTVTSVAMTVPTGLSVAGSPITSSGTLAVTFASGYSIPTTASQTNWDTAYTNRITSATLPLSITSNVISIAQSSASANGYLSSTDWSTFNGKQNAITLTTTGTSGAATLVGSTLNIPNYGSALSGYLPLTGGTLTGPLNITITYVSGAIPFKIDSSSGYGFYNSSESTLNFNYGHNATSTGYINYEGYQGGVTQFRNLIIADGKRGTIATFQGSTKNLSVIGDITASNFSGSSSGTNTGDQTLSGLGGVPTSRTLTINGVSYDLSADRSWTVSSSQWITSGSNIYYNTGYVGIGVDPLVKLHIQSSGSSYTSPADNNVATVYIKNTNSSSVNAHSILSLRTTGSTGGNPFISWDLDGVLGYAMGIDNADNDKLKINSGWSTLTSNTFMEFTTAGAATFNYSLTVSGIYYVPSTSYFVSGTSGYRFNSSGDTYNNFIIYDNGSFWSRIGGVIGGNTSISGTGGDNDPVLSLVGNSDNSYQWITRSINSVLNAGKNLVHFIGKEASTKNSGYFGYQWNANSSDSNFMTIGLYGVNHILKLYGNNSAVFSGTVTTGDVFYVGASGGGGGVWTWGLADAYIYSPSGKNLWLTASATITNGIKISTDGAATFSLTINSGDITTTGLYSTGIVRSYAAQGNIRSYSTNPANDAIIYAGWTGETGIEMRYNPNSAISYIQNNYPAVSGQEFGDIHFRRKVSTTYYTTMLLKANSANVIIGDTGDMGSRLQVTGGGSSSLPIINIVASGSGPWQRGVRMLNSGMVSGDSIMYALGYGDTAYSMGQFYFYRGSTTTQNRISMGLHSVDDIFNIFGNGNIGINTTSAPSYRFYVSGDIYATGDVIAYSDFRVKTNIRPLENVLNKINNSRGVLYDRIDEDSKNNIGFIAQELEKEFPELISTDKQGKKGVKYQNAVAVLFEAIKEQQKQINELKNKN